METINFHMKEKEAAWKEQRRQIANDLDYEEKQARRKCEADIKQARRKCEADIEQARRKCEADIEQARRKYNERITAVARDEDEYKHQARLAKDELRKAKLAELERIAELEGKEGGDK